MTHHKTSKHEAYPDNYHDTYSKTVFGFWVFLLSDFVMFASFFAVYVVLQNSTYGGPTAHDLFDLPFAFMQTLIILLSSLTSGLAGAFTHRKNPLWTFLFFGATAVLGIIFVGMEWTDFSRLISQGNTWQKSAFLSAFFSLVATHGAHMLFAILWTIVLLIPLWREGITAPSIRRLTCLRMFWQFLNIVWVFIYTIVYFQGGI